MAGVKKADNPFAAASAKPFVASPEDERKAAAIAGLCGAFLKESGFSLTEVASDFVIYRSGKGHQIAIRGHRWFCKLSSGEEFSGVGFVDLSDVVRGG